MFVIVKRKFPHDDDVSLWIGHNLATFLSVIFRPLFLGRIYGFWLREDARLITIVSTCAALQSLRNDSPDRCHKVTADSRHIDYLTRALSQSWLYR